MTKPALSPMKQRLKSIVSSKNLKLLAALLLLALAIYLASRGSIEFNHPDSWYSEQPK